MKCIRVAQEQLATRGYDLGNADGHLGPRTRKALARLRADNGLPDSPAVLLDWTSQPAKRASVVEMEGQSANEPARNDAAAVSPLDGDQELLTAGQRVVVMLPEQTEGSILTISDDDGTIEVPILGPVQAAGKRPSDVEKAIAIEFLDRYVATLVGAMRVSNVPTLSSAWNGWRQD